MKYKLKRVLLDYKPEFKLKCPQCHEWSYITRDQFYGKESVLCNCGFHETIDFNKSCCAVCGGSVAFYTCDRQGHKICMDCNKYE